MVKLLAISSLCLAAADEGLQLLQTAAVKRHTTTDFECDICPAGTEFNDEGKKGKCGSKIKKGFNKSEKRCEKRKAKKNFAKIVKKCCKPLKDVEDDCTGWSVDKSGERGGVCYMGGFDYRHQTVSKTFSGLQGGCTYTMDGVFDTWASVDSEPIRVTVNGASTNIVSRPHNSCNNGHSSHPYGTGRQFGITGSGIHGWQDCYKPFSTNFVAPADGKANVEMYMGVNQAYNDEGWGFHSVKFTQKECPSTKPVSKLTDNCAAWSVQKSANIGGKCYMGGFDNSAQTTRKTFGGFKSGCTYKFSVVVDTWASVDNEKITVTVGGKSTEMQSRQHNSCNNGWSSHPYGTGRQLGISGSGNHGWQDCYKPFETTFIANDKTVEVEMNMAVNQGANDEGWGFHDLKFEKQHCKKPQTPATITDSAEGWSNTKSGMKDGKLYMGAWDYRHQTVSKTFEGFQAGCQYTWNFVLDGYASVDNEPIRATVQGSTYNIGNRHWNSCSNGWQTYPRGFGGFLGAGTGWPADCYKNNAFTFTANAFTVDVSIYFGLNQGLGDEGWGFHDMTFVKGSCR